MASGKRPRPADEDERGEPAAAAEREPGAGVTPVSIYGRTYHLRGNEESGYLLELASLVDRRMREAAEATGTADTLKVAILAALNIADDCLQARRGTARKGSGQEPGPSERLARMVEMLDEALAG